jgi:hypothetical protein
MIQLEQRSGSLANIYPGFYKEIEEYFLGGHHP